MPTDSFLNLIAGALIERNKMNKSRVTNDNEIMLCTKATLSKTILSLEKEYEILEINTITSYFGFFDHFQILIKKR